MMCWCKQREHADPLQELGHLLIAELRVPQIADWLARRMKPRG